MEQQQYVVIEIQKLQDGTISTIVTQHPNLKEALNKYHTVLAYAALSDLPRHSCAILDEAGFTVRNETFTAEVNGAEGSI